jgi:hypothetical protein
MTLQKSAIHTIASSRADERGKQPINSFRRASASARRLRSSGAVPSTWSRMAEPARTRDVLLAAGVLMPVPALGVLAAAASKAVGRLDGAALVDEILPLDRLEDIAALG